jgi:hypothetical protein
MKMDSMTPARGRLRRLGRLVAPTAVALGAGLAFAAFTDDAANGGNRAIAADVTITEDVDARSPLFDLADWQPAEQGATVERCIGITNGGSVALPLTLRLDGAPAGGLGEYVDMRVEHGTRPAATDDAGCDGFAAGGEVYAGELADFPTTAAGRLAAGAERLAVGAERAYRITWTLQDTEEAEGQAVSGVNFLWETTTAE